jgi:hypothetical protein
MKRPRRPRQAFERLFSLKPTAKQHIHALLRRDPALSSRQLAKAVGCTTAYARIWRRNFFAPSYEVEEPDSLYEGDSASLEQSGRESVNTVSPMQEKS